MVEIPEGRQLETPASALGVVTAPSATVPEAGVGATAPRAVGEPPIEVVMAAGSGARVLTATALAGAARAAMARRTTAAVAELVASDDVVAAGGGRPVLETAVAPAKVQFMAARASSGSAAPAPQVGRATTRVAAA